MSFYFFSICSIAAAVVLVPFNLSVSRLVELDPSGSSSSSRPPTSPLSRSDVLMRFPHLLAQVYGSVDSHPDDEENSTSIAYSVPSFMKHQTVLRRPSRSGNSTLPHNLIDLLDTENASLTLHLLFTYLFSILACYFTYINFKKFVRNRQLFSLELVHSISGRTVLCSGLPRHLVSLSSRLPSLVWIILTICPTR